MTNINSKQKDSRDVVFKFMDIIHFYEAILFYFIINDSAFSDEDRDTDPKIVMMHAIKFGEKTFGRTLKDIYLSQDILSVPQLVQEMESNFYSSQIFYDNLH